MTDLTRHYEVRIHGISLGTRHESSRDAVASARRYFEIHGPATAQILMVANRKAVVVDTITPMAAGAVRPTTSVQ